MLSMCKSLGVVLSFPGVINDNCISCISRWYGTRMKSQLPKMLHPILGKPMILHALDAVLSHADLPPVVVVGHGAER